MKNIGTRLFFFFLMNKLTNKSLNKSILCRPSKNEKIRIFIFHLPARRRHILGRGQRGKEMHRFPLAETTAIEVKVQAAAALLGVIPARPLADCAPTQGGECYHRPGCEPIRGPCRRRLYRLPPEEYANTYARCWSMGGMQAGENRGRARVKTAVRRVAKVGGGGGGGL